MPAASERAHLQGERARGESMQQHEHAPGTMFARAMRSTDYEAIVLTQTANGVDRASGRKYVTRTGRLQRVDRRQVGGLIPVNKYHKK